jgi:hypothetical protein
VLDIDFKCLYISGPYHRLTAENPKYSTSVDPCGRTSTSIGTFILNIQIFYIGQSTSRIISNIYKSDSTITMSWIIRIEQCSITLL